MKNAYFNMRNCNARIAKPQRKDEKSPSLLVLPKEILSLVLSFIIKPRDLLNLEFVNILFYSLVHNSNAWQAALDEKLSEQAIVDKLLSCIESTLTRLDKKCNSEELSTKRTNLLAIKKEARYFREAFDYLSIKGADFLVASPQDKYKHTFLHAKNERQSDEEWERQQIEIYRENPNKYIFKTLF